MPSVGSLWVSVGARTKKFDKAMKRMRKRLKRFAAGAKRVAKAAFVAGAAAAAGLALLVRQVVNAGDAMDKMSKRTGLTAEFLSRLKFVAELGGSSIEDMEKGVKKLQKSASDAAQGLTTYQRAFDMLGVSVQTSSGELKDTETLFTEVLSALSKMTNHTQKAALAVDLFGRAGTKLLPMLSDGVKGFKALWTESERITFLWTGKTAAAAAQLKDDFSRLTSRLGAIATAFAVDLMPAINEAVTAITGFLMANKELISIKAREWANKMAHGIRFVARSFGGMIDIVTGGWDGAVAFMESGWLGLKGVVHSVIGNIVRGWNVAIGGMKMAFGGMLRFIGEGLSKIPGMASKALALMTAGGALGQAGRTDVELARKGEGIRSLDIAKGAAKDAASASMRAVEAFGKMRKGFMKIDRTWGALVSETATGLKESAAKATEGLTEKISRGLGRREPGKAGTIDLRRQAIGRGAIRQARAQKVVSPQLEEIKQALVGIDRRLAGGVPARAGA